MQHSGFARLNCDTVRGEPFRRTSDVPYKRITLHVTQDETATRIEPPLINIEQRGQSDTRLSCGGPLPSCARTEVLLGDDDPR